MVCAEWWGLEVNIFVAGMIGVSSLAAFTLMYTVLTLLYTLPLCISITAGTRVGNAVGEQDIPQAQRLSVMIMSLAIGIQSALALGLYVTQDWWPYLFTTDEEVIDIVRDVTPIICVYIVIDSLQTSIGGILRGSGKQALGAVSYVFSYYVVGLSLGLFFAFHFELNTKGLWMGTGCAAISCLIILGGYFAFAMKWEKVVEECQKRLEEKGTAKTNEEEMTEMGTADIEEEEAEEQYSPEDVTSDAGQNDDLGEINAIS